MDAIVVGSGPNGLTAAAELGRHGWSVLVIEAKDRPGGALYSLETTRPGFIHDVGAAFFPFSKHSPAFRALNLEETGLEWRQGAFESSHPAPDGTCASISSDPQRTAESFGIDGEAMNRLADWQKAMGARLVESLLAPLPALGEAWRLGPGNVFGLLRAGISSPVGFSCRTFRSAPAQRVIPGLALHVDLGPDDFSGAGLGLVLALLAAESGFRVPVGGAGAITRALLRRIEENGGRVLFNTHVDRIVVRDRRAVAVHTNAGEEIPARRAVLADVGAPALFLKMLPAKFVPGVLRRAMTRFEYGWGTFKMDWALSGPVPWTLAEPRQAAVIHAGDSLDDLRSFTQQVRRGELPTNPYLVIGQQSLLDPSRAPPGCHTLWAYSHVPSYVEGGWANARQGLVDRIEERIEGLAPGFRSRILARAVFSPADLESMNENLVGGDLGGGSARFGQQLFFRPAFPYFRYRTPVRRLYLASASCHPGAGVHGACGFNAAQMALKDTECGH